MEYSNIKKKKIIRSFIVIFILILIITIISLLILKYEVEGEKNMPFELSQIIVVSTAEGLEIEGDSTWNLELIQNNDIYIHIGKNKDYRETEVIKNITIQNIQIDEMPAKGSIILYRPSENEGKIFEYEDKYIIDDKLEYKGNETTNIKELEIANQGGVISFRCSNKNLRRVSIKRK